MSRKDGKDRGLFERPAGSGIWWIRYTDGEGQEHREKVGSKELARSIYQQRKTEVRLDKFDPERVNRKNRWTVAKMMTHYREKRSIIGPKNQGEDQRYADYWTEKLGKLELDQVSLGHLEKWREQRTRDGVKPATINRALTYLKVYFNLALRDGHCKTNPVEKLKPLRENNERTRYLDPETEFPKLKQAMSGEEWDLVEFALFTGLRRSEQFLLRWEQVNFGAEVLEVPEPKSGQKRFIQLNQEALSVLQRQKQRYPGSPWAFPAPTKPDRPRDGHNFVKRVLKVACSEVGIQDLTWHDLRRSFASWLTMAGAHPKAVQNLLGHTTGRMTERYAYLAPSHLKDAVGLLSSSVGEQQGTSQPAPKPAPE
jgi:integrase